MNAELKAKWIAALRSGKYQQMRGALRRRIPSYDEGGQVTHCCIGVLADIIDPDAWHGNMWVQGESESSGRLPVDVRMTVGLPYSTETRLINANDNGATFVEIAEMIEREA